MGIQGIMRLDLGFIPDIIDMVVPPKIGLQTIKEAVANGYDNFGYSPKGK